VEADTPAAADVRVELGRILAGAGFVRNARMSRFLTFLVERHLEGRDAEVKETLIAYEVFGRRPDYDPKQDSIVRTEAARLRARLAEHYGGPGRAATVIIDIPRGGYVPVFRYRETVHEVRVAPAAAFPGGRRFVLAGFCVAMMLGGAAWWSVEGERTPVAVAILPLSNLDHDASGDAFADGLTSELGRELARIDGLALRSRDSSFLFRGRARDARMIGPQLGADYLIDGSVLRTREALRIDVQLIRVRDGAPVWSGQFHDRPLSAIFDIEDEISLAVVNTLRLHLGRGRRHYEKSVAAYEEYLAARAVRFGADPTRYDARVSGFQRAIASDPGFAPAYAGLASTYAIRSVQFPGGHPPDELAKLRAAADRAIEIDPILPEAYEALAMADARDGHWSAAEEEFREAIKTDPHEARTRAEFAMWFLSVLGRSDEAIEQAQRAEIDDPLASDVQLALAWCLMQAGRFREAERHCEKLGADVHLRGQCLGRARFGQGRTTDGITALRASAGEMFNPQTLGFLGYALARSGQRDEARRMAAAPAAPNEEALIHAGLGDKDRAIEALERMAARGPQRVGQYLNSPELSLLAGDPRVAALRRKIGLPQ
jgi:TolB-like protein/Flp pilus assembly protein TadD